VAPPLSPGRHGGEEPAELDDATRQKQQQRAPAGNAPVRNVHSLHIYGVGTLNRFDAIR
jgi:hypothetical protein